MEFLDVACVWRGTRATSFSFCPLVFGFVRQKFRPPERNQKVDSPAVLLESAIHHCLFLVSFLKQGTIEKIFLIFD
jgi:hypothetical protein